MNLPTELIDAVKKKDLILFVGAGVSSCLGLPSWSQLIDKIGEDLGYDPALLSSYGDYLAVAEMYKLTKGSFGELRSWIDQTWHSGVNIGKSAIHSAIVDLDFPLIYTTNYDHWIERAFSEKGKAYTKIVSIADFPGIRSGQTQIIKFHGDVTNDETLVIDETSYFERMSFEGPLDIKLRSDSIGRGILFIGYSLRDINIRYLLYKLSQLRKGVPITMRPTSYLFSPRPNPVQERILDGWGLKMISSEVDHPRDALQKFMREIAQKSKKASCKK